MPARSPTKKEVLLAFLRQGVAMVHLDARRPGVEVPPQHAGDPHLRLNLSYRYAIPDFEVGDERIEVTLSFGGRSFHCVLPWSAVFGITSNVTGDGQVWTEDLPVEVVQATAHGPQPEVKAKSPRRPAARLAAVESGEAAGRKSPGGPQQEDSRSSEPAQGQPRRHLRLVR